MTAEQRIEKLLNRAGQTISDLPRKQGLSVSEPYSGADCHKANSTAWRWYLNIDTGMDDYYSTCSKVALELYILHLTDIIDRMETALENVCGERDYLRSVVCGLCTNFREDGADACETCIVGEGVPEYWRADDDKR